MKSFRSIRSGHLILAWATLCAPSLLNAQNEPIAHSIESETIVTSPEDRKRNKLGVGEEVKLTLTPGHEATWTLSGGGKINGGSGSVSGVSSVVVTAPEDPASISIDANCEEDGEKAGISFTVVKPSGVTMEPKKIVPKSSPALLVSMDCEVYITPSDVNFEKISVTEYGEQQAIVDVDPDGNPDPEKYFYYARNIVHRGRAGYTGMIEHIEDKGTKMDGGDNPQMATAGPVYKDGFYMFKIPWHYKINEHEKGKFTEVEQKGVLTASGNGFKFEVSKAGAAGEASTTQ